VKLCRSRAHPAGDLQGFLGLRAYGDFDAANRAPGWSTWLTFAISPAAPTIELPCYRAEFGLAM
jgi:hypothetical protein